MEIQKTSNYNLFQTIVGNRIINLKKVNNLIKDIKDGLNLLPYAPIIVYKKEEKLHIVDGQHRFEACKKLEHEVYYVTCNELDLRQIALINSRSDKWKNKDFLDCYIRLEIEDYVILEEFLSEFKLSYTVAIDLLYHGRPLGNGDALKKFKDGLFKVRYKEEAKKLVQLTEDVFGRYKFFNNKGLIEAVRRIRDAEICDFDVLKDKIKQAPNIMEKHVSWKDYALNIEKVYNYRNSKRVIILQ